MVKKGFDLFMKIFVFPTILKNMMDVKLFRMISVTKKFQKIWHTIQIKIH